MLSTLRSFSKGKLATILVTIIIIPFVFWGMGSVFRGGKTNSVAKINSFNISTKDLVDHINNSKLSADKIKENINNNILEEFLTELVSNSVIDIEIEDLNIMISDKNLAGRIKKNKSIVITSTAMIGFLITRQHVLTLRKKNLLTGSIKWLRTARYPKASGKIMKINGAD